MRSNLFSSVTLVFGFWWVFLSFNWLISGEPEPAVIRQIVGNASLTIISLIWGMVLAAGVYIGQRFFAKSQVEGSEFKGMSASIGPFPQNRKQTPRTEQVSEWHPLMDTWISENKEKYPAHYKFLKVVAEILDAHPLHPASVEPGGHGDRTLVDHSHFVAEFMLNAAPSYEYKGLKDSGGTSHAKSIDPLYKFNNEDVLIPIVGLVHDIGKVECYDVTNEGIPIEKRAKHDWRGRFILTGIDEFWELPPDDQETLLDVVGYYHHPWEMPLSVSDRSRSLVEMVMAADIDAGNFEAENPRMATEDDVVQMIRRMLKARGDNPDSALISEKYFKFEIKIGDTNLSLHQSKLLHAFETMLFEDGALNGSNIDKRIGFKIGNTIYCNEEAVRDRLGVALSAKRLVDLKKNDGQKVLTTRLIEVLGYRGSLINVVDGKEFGPGRSIFKVTTKTTGGSKPRELVWPSVFMLDASKYPRKLVEKIPDIEFEVTAVHPVFGWDSAINKNKSIEAGAAEPALPLSESEAKVEVAKEQVASDQKNNGAKKGKNAKPAQVSSSAPAAAVVVASVKPAQASSPAPVAAVVVASVKPAQASSPAPAAAVVVASVKPAQASSPAPAAAVVVASVKPAQASSPAPAAAVVVASDLDPATQVEGGAQAQAQADQDTGMDIIDSHINPGAHVEVGAQVQADQDSDADIFDSHINPGAHVEVGAQVQADQDSDADIFDSHINPGAQVEGGAQAQQDEHNQEFTGTSNPIVKVNSRSNSEAIQNASQLISEAHENGDESIARAIKFITDSGAAIPERAAEKNTATKRDKTHASSKSNKAKNPSKTNEWWEGQDISKVEKMVLSGMAGIMHEGIQVNMNGNPHVFFDIERLMSVLGVEIESKVKFANIVKCIKPFSVNAKDGIATHIGAKNIDIVNV